MVKTKEDANATKIQPIPNKSSYDLAEKFSSSLPQEKEKRKRRLKRKKKGQPRSDQVRSTDNSQVPNFSGRCNQRKRNSK